MDSHTSFSPDIPNSFGLKWVSDSNKRGILLLPDYIRINDGFANDAVIFSQIMYWHTPDSDGNSRLRVTKDNHLWLARNYDDWEKECGIGKNTARHCLDRLEERHLIIRTLGGFAGKKTTFIRMDWQGFENRMRLLFQEQMAKNPFDRIQKSIYDQYR